MIKINYILFVRPGRIDIDINLKKATLNQLFDIIPLFEYDADQNEKFTTKIKDNIKDFDICPSAYEARLVNNSFGDKLNDINKTIDYIINKIKS